MTQRFRSAANAKRRLSPADIEKLKDELREALPTVFRGGFSYGAFAGAVKRLVLAVMSNSLAALEFPVFCGMSIGS